MKNGRIEKATDIDENCFVSTAVITVKKDKAVKIALDSRKLNGITVKGKHKYQIRRSYYPENQKQLLTEKQTRYGYPSLIWTTRTINYRYRRKQWNCAYLL